VKERKILFFTQSTTGNTQNQDFRGLQSKQQTEIGYAAKNRILNKGEIPAAESKRAHHNKHVLAVALTIDVKVSHVWWWGEIRGNSDRVSNFTHCSQELL
jgi:hypothetical protein